jgi:NTE family protein
MLDELIKRLQGRKKKFKNALVLSGGGARGFAHLGAIMALEEKGIKPDIIAGVSAGSIVGAFYAAGYEPEKLFDYFKKKGLFSLSKFNVPTTGLLSLAGLELEIREKIAQENIEELPTPLLVGLSNFSLGRMEYHMHGNIALKVRASSSIPVLFTPVKIGEHWYVDGGLYDNLPIRPLREHCERIVAVNVNPINEVHKFRNLKEVAIRTFHLTVDARVQDIKSLADILIEPLELAHFDILDSSRAKEMFEIGYRAARRSITKSK